MYSDYNSQIELCLGAINKSSENLIISQFIIQE